METLPEWFKTRRKEMGFTQAQVASKLGVHQAQVSALESGRSKPDQNALTKIEQLFGIFVNAVPAVKDLSKKEMPSAAMEALKAYRESKENGFCIDLGHNLIITADRNQYILRQGTNASYFTELTPLIKYMIISQVRQSSVSSVQEMADKLQEIYKLIEVKFNEYDPAHISAGV